MSGASRPAERRADYFKLITNLVLPASQPWKETSTYLIFHFVFGIRDVS